MAHTHEQDRTTFYVAQLSTIGVCGLLGVICILLYQQNLLRFILAENRHFVVPIAGGALLGLVALRSLVLLTSSRQGDAHHDHDPCHGHDCDHDHEHDHSHDHVHADHDHACSHHDCGADGHHEHDHGHAHDHSHGDDCGHDHSSWNPWRYIVLLLPIVLYFLNMPNAGFTASYSGAQINAGDLNSIASGRYADNTGLQIDKKADTIQVVGVVTGSPAEKAGMKTRDVITHVETVSLQGKSLDEAVKELRGQPDTKVKLTVKREGQETPQEIEVTRAMDAINADFKILEKAAYTEQGRESYNGRVVQVKGLYAPGPNDRVFSLVRYRITCCAGDASPLRVVVTLDSQCKDPLGDLKSKQWLSATGRVQYLPNGKRPGEFLTVLVMSSPKDVRDDVPEANPYIQ